MAKAKKVPYRPHHSARKHLVFLLLSHKMPFLARPRNKKQFAACSEVKKTNSNLIFSTRKSFASSTATKKKRFTIRPSPQSKRFAALSYYKLFTAKPRHTKKCSCRKASPHKKLVCCSIFIVEKSDMWPNSHYIKLVFKLHLCLVYVKKQSQPPHQSRSNSSHLYPPRAKAK